MNWNFIPERQADLADIANEIHSSVTMEDVIHSYTPELRTRNHRAPCPFHNGKDYNFSYTRNGYRCFVCGASGDVISFVKDNLGLPTRLDAMKRINADLRLNLPIGTNVSDEISTDLARKRAERRAREAEKRRREEAYHALLDEWIELDKAKRNEDPTSDAYADAVKRIDYVSYKLDLARGEQYY